MFDVFAEPAIDWWPGAAISTRDLRAMSPMVVGLDEAGRSEILIEGERLPQPPVAHHPKLVASTNE